MHSSTTEAKHLVALVMWIDENFSGLSFDLDLRKELAYGCFDLALEHQASVSLLFQHRCFGSQFALMRVGRVRC
jgi:hypothetical protein